MHRLAHRGVRSSQATSAAVDKSAERLEHKNSDSPLVMGSSLSWHTVRGNAHACPCRTSCWRSLLRRLENCLEAGKIASIGAPNGRAQERRKKARKASRFAPVAQRHA